MLEAKRHGVVLYLIVLGNLVRITLSNLSQNCSVEAKILKYVACNVFGLTLIDNPHLFIDKYEEAKQMKYFEQKVTKVLLQYKNSAHVYRSIFIAIYLP